MCEHAVHLFTVRGATTGSHPRLSLINVNVKEQVCKAWPDRLAVAGVLQAQVAHIFGAWILSRALLAAHAPLAASVPKYGVPSGSGQTAHATVASTPCGVQIICTLGRQRAGSCNTHRLAMSFGAACWIRLVVAEIACLAMSCWACFQHRAPRICLCCKSVYVNCQPWDEVTNRSAQPDLRTYR